jgi:hypothetical protein
LKLSDENAVDKYKSRIVELEAENAKLKEDMPTKEEAVAYFRMDGCPACQDTIEYCNECGAAYNMCIIKLQRIAGK